MYILKCSKLCLGYDGKEIVHDLDFEIKEGDYLCIIGENGSGKSTLMRTILGLQKPVSGEVLFGNGADRTGIGYLPQATAVQKDFPASVEEIVISGFQSRCGLRPFYNKEEKRIAAENLARMGITDLRSRCFRELSGGQQQRVLLARALCSAQKMLLLDEPVSGLDPTASEDMYELVKKLNDEGMTVIMILHDHDAAVKYGTHILKIGKTVFFGKAEDYSEYNRECSSAEGTNG